MEYFIYPAFLVRYLLHCWFVLYPKRIPRIKSSSGVKSLREFFLNFFKTSIGSFYSKENIDILS